MLSRRAFDATNMKDELERERTKGNLYVVCIVVPSPILVLELPRASWYTYLSVTYQLAYPATSMLSRSHTSSRWSFDKRTIPRVDDVPFRQPPDPLSSLFRS